MSFLRRHWSHALLLLTPLTVALEFLAPDEHRLLFFVSMLAIMPLAGYIGSATEQLAARLGGGIGGLLNATFGNAAELIIAGLALQRGLTGLVKASITGSIIGNILLVFGASALVGGFKFNVQRFNRTAAGMGTTMLLLSVVGLVVPAVFHRIANTAADVELTLDTEIAVVLFLTYCASLYFMLRTHRDLYGTGSHHGDHDAPTGSVKGAVVTLLLSTLAVAVVSEVLVGAVAHAAAELGMTEVFVGVVVVALVGNAAEHFSAVVLASRNQMDAAISIAVGSSTQIALFVAPVLVFLSYFIGPHPMDLLFTTFELVAIAVSVLTIAFIAHDGETHWMEGVQLLAVYAIVALGFFFLP